jgi:hypothetical protein
MPYVPNLADAQEVYPGVPQSQNYVPTAADAQAVYQQSLLQQQSPQSTSATINATPNYAQSILGGASQSQLPLIGNLGNAVNAGLGALQSERNFGQDIYSTFAPQTAAAHPIPQLPQSSGTAYDIGKIGGNIGLYLAGGAGLDAARGLVAAATLPIASDVAGWLGGSAATPTIARNALGAGAYGAVTNPQNKAESAALGFGLGGAAGAIPAAAPAIQKISDIFNPQKYASQLLNYMGNGASNVAENAKSLATDIKTAYNAQVAPLAQGFQDIRNQVGDKPIYQAIPTRASSGNNFNNIDDVIDYVNDSHGANVEDPDELKEFLSDHYGKEFDNNKQILNFFNSAPATTFQRYGQDVLGNPNSSVNSGLPGTSVTPSYLDTFPNIRKYVTPDIQDLHSDFIADPTYNNARKLFSKYAAETARLSGKPPGFLDSADINQLQALTKGKAAIDNDIQSFLAAKNPDLASQYNALKSNWVQNVIPYRASGVKKLLGQNPTIPTNIHSLFATARGLPDANDMKVFSDLPPVSQNKIAYSALGKEASSKNPQSLANNFSKLPEQGLGDLVNPDIKDKFNMLKGIMEKRQTLNTLMGAGLGYAAGSHFGLSPEMLAAGGAYIGNKVLPAISRSPLVTALANGAFNAGQGLYRPAAATILANTIPGGQ